MAQTHTLTVEDFTAILIPTMPYQRLGIARYIDRAKKRKLFKDEYIISVANDPDDLYYYYVEKGQLRCSFTKINGEPATLFYRNEGNAFSAEYGGIASLGQYKMHYVATRDTIVFGFTQKQLYEIMQEDPAIYYEFIMVCHMAFGQMGHRISNGSVPSSMERIIIWLRKLCAVHTPDAEGVYTIESNITIQQLAEMLFIHVTTCSRLLNTLETEGIIERTRHTIRVLAPDRLEEFECLD
ncbi:MAG: Crp/Fnr family transcriptional regulator [Coriobacteriales bacterium]|jgi:CRP/FNR family cyclic AMP-dependent transcriptional regulator|nr:Crp/Fnr family transcriptional regulator [Coriobacteriales bacterium]